MKALRHIAGVLLASIGVMLVLGGVGAIFGDREIPLWIGVMYIVLGFLPLYGAYALLRSTIFAPAKLCPKCGGAKRQEAGVLRKSHNLWLFHIGGWLLSSLWGASREQQVRCADCDTLYMTNTRGTQVAGVLLWILLVLILLGIIAQGLGGKG
jgi:hypothetical protein